MRCVTLDAFHVHHVDLRRTRKLNKFVLIRIVLTAQLYLQEHGFAASFWTLK
jgi:hypothetical protein